LTYLRSDGLRDIVIARGTDDLTLDTAFSEFRRMVREETEVD
jgi:hypothetical protein